MGAHHPCTGNASTSWGFNHARQPVPPQTQSLAGPPPPHHPLPQLPVVRAAQPWSCIPSRYRQEHCCLSYHCSGPNSSVLSLPWQEEEQQQLSSGLLLLLVRTMLLLLLLLLILQHWKTHPVQPQRPLQWPRLQSLSFELTLPQTCLSRHPAAVLQPCRCLAVLGNRLCQPLPASAALMLPASPRAC